MGRSWVGRVLGMIGIASLALMPSAEAASGHALVIGEASYVGLPPLAGCALSAHAMAAALRRLGFSVDEQDDASSGALYGGIDGLAQRMTAAPTAPTFVYLCGYTTGYNDRPFLLPVDANVTRPSDVLSQGVLLKSLLNAVVNAKPATAVLAVDAVRLPKATTPLTLDALEKPALPPTLGYIAVADAAPGNLPMPLAATMVPLMNASPLQGAVLLTETGQQLSGLKDADVAALSLPNAGLYLAGAPPAVAAAPPPATSPAPPPATSPAPPSAAVAASPPAATPAPPSAAIAASPPAATPAPPPVAARAPLSLPDSSAPSLPDESAMTDDQRHRVQRALSQLGYYDGRPDGIFGPDTRAAIRRWQYEEHQPMTGHLTGAEASRLAATWD
jgi:hypothetical protein